MLRKLMVTLSLFMLIASGIHPMAQTAGMLPGDGSQTIDSPNGDMTEGNSHGERPLEDGRWANHDETGVFSTRGQGRSGPDMIPRNITFNSTNLAWFGYSVGTVGTPTEIEVYVTNMGTDNATDVDVRIEIKDFFSNVMNEYQTNINDIPPGEDARVFWPDWTPQHSSKIHATISIDLAGDTNQTNNVWTYWGSGWWVNKWLDEAEDQLEWSGDISSDQWHITDSVQADPAPEDHSDPTAWYAGTESPVLGDFYTAGMNASLISKTIDLTRMNPYYPAFLNLKYYGGALPEDHLEIMVSVDGGDTWVDTRNRVTGVTTTDGQPDWLVRIDNWVDEDENGEMNEDEFDYGIDISEFIGHQVNFRFTFISGQTSTGLGYYLDDFIIYGFEAENEISLASIGQMGTTHVNETEDVVATFWNQGTDTSPELTAQMSVEWEDGFLYSENVTFGPIQAGSSEDAHWTFTPNMTGEYEIIIELHDPPAGEDSSYYNNRQTRRVHVSEGGTGVLVVDDDGGDTNSGRLHLRNFEVDYEYLLVRALEQGGYSFDVYHVLFNERGPDLQFLQGYHTVIWTTGWDGTGRSMEGTLSSGDREDLAEFMDSGGSLWLISQETVFDLSLVAPGFLENRLHVTGYVDDAGTPGIIDGVEGNEVVGDIGMEATVRVPANDRADSIEPDEQSEGMTYQDEDIQSPTTGPFNGIYHNGSHRLVYTSFAFSAILDSEDRTDFASDVLDWLFAGIRMEFDPGRSMDVEVNGVANYTLTLRNYGNINRTVQELVVGNRTDSWSAEIVPRIEDGVPETVIGGMGTLEGYLIVTPPADSLAGSMGEVEVRFVVKETGEEITATTRTTVVETVSLELLISPATQARDPGDNASYMLEITNEGNVKSTVNITVNGTVETWATVEDPYVVLEADDLERVTLVLGIPSDAKAGNRTLEVVVEGRHGDLISRTVETLNLTVNQFHSLNVTKVRAPAGGKVDPLEPEIELMVELDNLGNGEDTVNVSLSGTFQDADQWTFGSSVVTLPPFARGYKTNLSLRIDSRAPGGNYNVTVEATSEDGSLVTGYVILTVLRPDLYLTSDGVVFDYDLVVGQPTSFTVKVFNGGEVDSPRATLTVYDKTGEEIFREETPSVIQSGGFSELTVDWTPQYRGPEELGMHINEDKEIVEMTFENNTITRSVQVRQANLEVGPADIQFYVNGKEKDKLDVGDLVSITVQIRNMDRYSYGADDVPVSFYVDGVPIGNETTDVEADNIAYLSVDWEAEKGLHNIKVVVDPGDTIDEAREDDNEANMEVVVEEPEEKGGLAFDPMWIAGAVAIALVLSLIYGIVRGVIPSPVKKSTVEVAERNYKCSECGKRIKKGSRYYHCACGQRAHIKCAKKAELCSCLRRVRIGQ